MKTLKTTGIISLLLVCMLTTVSAQSDAGIDFFHGSFAEAVEKAKEEKKLIFMDAYTAWCGPCKWMAANTFTDNKVAKYYNDNFVNVKMDMEKGEGPALARKYKVRAYPTLLFINPNESVAHRDLGAKRPNEFLNLGKTVVKKQL